MNYRHAYHAGNFADVLKHATLALVIEHLTAKPTPFRVLDTHAGRGRYDLSALEASKTREWESGIGRLLAEPVPTDIAPLLSPYLSAVSAASGPLGDSRRHYPGSPLIARHLMRTGDRMIANELHPEDVTALADLFIGDRQVKTTNADAWTSIKAHLPPPERRGVTIIDPPFEEPGEFPRLVQALVDATRRFAIGIIIVWYPVKDPNQVATFRAEAAATGLSKLLDIELMVKAPDSAGLPGCGLLILNPPFGLEQKLTALTAFLARRLAQDRSATSHVTWIAPEKARLP